MNHILSADQFTREELLELFKESKKLQSGKIKKTMKDKILATVFFEASTRTRLSFETAMLKLGGQVISIPNMETSSMNKGETIEDTGRMISTFADVIAIRAPVKGQVAGFAKYSSVPVINAGDGTGEHPTQHLLDFYTIWKSRGTLDGLTLGLMGDCKNSRVLRGMARMASQFDIKLIFISPKELQIARDIKRYLKNKKISFSETRSLDEVINKLDVLEVNRIRHEYQKNKAKALKMGQQFIVSKAVIQKGKKYLVVLDPLPRVNTVQIEVDDMPQAKYFEAVENGIYVRMALINKLLA